MATGKKIVGLLKFLVYFAVLLSAACLAAAPCMLSCCEAQMRLQNCPEL